MLTQAEWVAIGVPCFLAIVGIAFHAGLVRGKIKQLSDKCNEHDYAITQLNTILTNHVDHLYKKVNENAIALTAVSVKLDSVCLFIKGNGRKEKE